MLTFADAMIKELEELKVELMVSIWPQVDKLSENYEQMLENGFLIRTDRGIHTAHDFQGQTVYFDPTNPGARKFVWDTVHKNYYKKGIKVFWLDEAEPECKFTEFKPVISRLTQGPQTRFMTSTTTVITSDPTSPLATYTLAIMHGHFTRAWRQQVRKILSIYYVVPGQEARDSALWSGVGISHLHGQACEISWQLV